MPTSLTLKTKFFLGFGLYMLILALVATVSYLNLQRMESRFRTITQAGKIIDSILEARRFEKNALLYGRTDDLREALTYLTEAQAALGVLADVAQDAGEDSPLPGVGRSIDDYRGVVAVILEQAAVPANLPRGQEADLRRFGKEMVEQAERLLETEQQRIADILATLKLQLLVAVVAAILSGVLVGHMLFGRLIRALEKFLGATEEIAAGRFQHLTDTETAPETRRIVEAFNTMVDELERRQDQLVQSKKLSSLGTLAAGIAHQLNNPLNNIATSGQIALEELESGDAALLRKMLGNVESEALRARDIVKGLLEFAREKPFSPASARLAEVVAKTLRLVSSQLPHGIEVVSDIPPDLTVVVDTQRFQEALLNLLINAGQAIGAGPGRIDITARPEAAGKVRMRVRDTGPGIPRELLGRVFDPFFTTKDDGTGLGLSIVYGIIQRHGGDIAVESAPGHGATFSITLPTAVQ